MKRAGKRKAGPTRTVQHTASGGPQLVWSGPEASGPPGNTRRVYEELFGSAKRSLWVVSFGYADGPDVFRRLAQHLDATPRLRVTLVLNVRRPKTQKALRRKTGARRFAKRFWNKGWPGKIRPRVYYDPRPIAGETGKLHAKVVVADEERALITSANLTPAAWDDNIELGLFVRDPALAGGVVAHFERLIELGYLRKLPE